MHEPLLESNQAATIEVNNDESKTCDTVSFQSSLIKPMTSLICRLHRPTCHFEASCRTSTCIRTRKLSELEWWTSPFWSQMWTNCGTSSTPSMPEIRISSLVCRWLWPAFCFKSSLEFFWPSTVDITWKIATKYARLIESTTGLLFWYFWSLLSTLWFLVSVFQTKDSDFCFKLRLELSLVWKIKVKLCQ